MSNNILKPLDPHLLSAIKTDNRLVLNYSGFNSYVLGTAFNVSTLIGSVCALKMKIKYKGKKYIIQSYTHSVSFDKTPLDNYLVSAYLQGKSKTNLTIILEAV